MAAGVTVAGVTAFRVTAARVTAAKVTAARPAGWFDRHVAPNLICFVELSSKIQIWAGWPQLAGRFDRHVKKRVTAARVTAARVTAARVTAARVTAARVTVAKVTEKNSSLKLFKVSPG